MHKRDVRENCKLISAKFRAGERNLESYRDLGT